jgi:hypothetical protein
LPLQFDDRLPNRSRAPHGDSRRTASRVSAGPRRRSCLALFGRHRRRHGRPRLRINLIRGDFTLCLPLLTHLRLRLLRHQLPPAPGARSVAEEARPRAGKDDSRAGATPGMFMQKVGSRSKIGTILKIRKRLNVNDRIAIIGPDPN